MCSLIISSRTGGDISAEKKRVELKQALNDAQVLMDKLSKQIDELSRDLEGWQRRDSDFCSEKEETNQLRDELVQKERELSERQSQLDTDYKALDKRSAEEDHRLNESWRQVHERSALKAGATLTPST